MAMELSCSLGNSPEVEDFTVTCGKQQKIQFKISSLVLQKSSLYFQTMFANNWKEVIDGKADFPEVEEEVMEIIITFIKTQELPKEYKSKELCIKVMEYANLLEIPRLFISCVRILVVTNLNLDTAAYLLDVVTMCKHWELETNSKESISVRGLQARIKTFVAQNFCQFALTKEFLKMDGGLLHALLQHPELDTNSFDVLERIVKEWMNANVEKRKEKVESMLEELADDNGVPCYQLLNNIQLEEITGNLVSHEKIKQRIWKFSRCYPNHGENLFLFKPNRVLQHAFERTSYTFTSCEWRKRVLPSFSLLDCVEVVGYSGHVYMFGSPEWKAKQLVTRVTRYFPCTDTTISTGNLAFPVLFVGAAGLDGALYILGNRRNGTKAINTIQRYCTVTNFCEEITMVDESLKPLGIWASASSFLYVLCFEDPHHLKLLCFDPLSNEWRLATTVPHDGACRYTMSGDTLFLMKPTGMCTYDIALNEWAQIDIKHENWAREVSVSTTWVAIEVHGITVNGNYMWPFTRCGQKMLLTFDNYGRAHIFEIKLSQWLSALDVKRFMPHIEPFIDTQRNCAISNCAVLFTTL